VSLFEITIQPKEGDAWPVVARYEPEAGALEQRNQGRLELDPKALVSLRPLEKAYGLLLGKALFRDDIRDAFVRALGIAGQQNEPLHVVLLVDAAGLRDLHWEQLYAPLDRTWDYLLLNQLTPFSLYPPSQVSRPFPAIGRRDLRALVLVAGPQELEGDYGLAPFDVVATAESVQQALGDIPCDMLAPVEGAISPPSLNSLCERLTAGTPSGTYTLLHLVCHGRYSADVGETVLYFPRDESGRPVPATMLIERLSRLDRLPHVAFLSTCESADPRAEAGLGGLGQRMVRELGIPAVLAMTGQVSIATAQALATAFYARLRAHGEPDLALCEALSGLQGRYDATVPALFSRLRGRALWAEAPGRPLPEDRAESLRTYRQVLVNTSRHLPLRGVDVGASDPTGDQRRLDLSQVYVDLATRTQVPLSGEEKAARREPASLEREGRETRPLRALEAAVAERRLVILGDPGSGKTTFINHLAFCLAIHGLEPGGGWLERLPCWPEAEAGLVPIPVILRDFARWLPPDTPEAVPRLLWDYIAGRLEAQNLASAADPLRRALEEGEAIVLLDGLDEIPTREARALVRDAVAAFAQRYPQSRLVVTCRTLSYQDPAGQLAGLPAFELAPFDADKIDRFIEAWYAELARLPGRIKPEEAGTLAGRLREAVRRPDLWRLAPNPLLLTVMALVHTHKGRLPDARALLYEDTVDILLWRWEQLKIGGDEESPTLRKLLLEAGRGDVDLKRVLWRLAFEAHQAGGDGDDEALADVGELSLEKALAGLHPQGSRDWAQKIIVAMKLRAGLLLERAPGVFTFPHRTFQEYLAGAHLAAQADFARQAAGLVEEGASWRVVVLLAVGRLVYLGGDTDKPLALVGELCPERSVDHTLAWQKAWLAGEVLLEAGLNRVQDGALGRDLVRRLRQRLVDLLEKGRLTPVERAAAGRALAGLADPRPGVGVSPESGLPDMVWCEVPAGPFLMGSRDDPMAYGDEQPQHLQEMPYAYWMARYPVTNAQFDAFVAAGGYAQARYWPEAEAAGHWQAGQVTMYRDKEPRDRPVDPGQPYNLPNHPVVNVSWYEALAFARWLAEGLASSSGQQQVWRDGRLELVDPDLKNRSVRLPTEAEWEKAARGTDGRIFPWAGRADPNRANYRDTQIGTTSAVGCFPAGASPYGVLDSSGNVYEWCQTVWRDDYEGYEEKAVQSDAAQGSRVLRGGAFLDDQGGVRCAYRYRGSPNYWSSIGGFRVVVAPGLPLVSGDSDL